MTIKFTPGKSAPFHLSQEEKFKILRAFVYVFLSMMIAGLVSLFAAPLDQMPAWIVPVVPLINAFLYGCKLWISDNR